jgi:hypothetical protein
MTARRDGVGRIPEGVQTHLQNFSPYFIIETVDKYFSFGQQSAQIFLFLGL